MTLILSFIGIFAMTLIVAVVVDLIIEDVRRIIRGKKN